MKVLLPIVLPLSESLQPLISQVLSSALILGKLTWASLPGCLCRCIRNIPEDVCDLFHSVMMIGKHDNKNLHCWRFTVIMFFLFQYDPLFLKKMNEGLYKDHLLNRLFLKDLRVRQKNRRPVTRPMRTEIPPAVAIWMPDTVIEKSDSGEITM